MSCQLDHYQRLDFTYNEQRLGSWAVQLGGDRFSSGKLWPMCRRDVIAELHGLSIDLKMSVAVQRAVIDKLWPELNSVPFNSYTGVFAPFRNLRNKVRRLPTFICR
jgi:hypothetical protein